MDNLTHSLFALTLAQSPLRKAGRGTTITLLVTSSAPDIDFVSAFIDGSTSYLAAHRGPTHGPLGVVGLAALTTLLVRLGYTLYGRRNEPPSGTWLFVAALAGCACHVLMDLPTVYGTRILTPFHTAWYSADWIPIIDIYLLALLSAGLVAAHLRPTTRHSIVAGVILLMGANYALRGTLHYRALQQAAGSSGPILEHLHSWPNTPHDKLPAGRSCLSESPQENDPHGCLIGAAALPSFLSPFHWRLVRAYANGYTLNEIDLLGRPLSADNRWYPSTDGPLVMTAARAGPADGLLRFSRFPASRILESSDGRIVVRFDEVRFLGGLGPLREDSEPRPLFSVLVPLDPNRAGPEPSDR
jgi:membrane-bound metal-dependent hydrolase YbcI (DUF457 family)